MGTESPTVLSPLIAVSTALAGMPVRTAILSINAGRFMVWVDFGAVVGNWVLSVVNVPGGSRSRRLVESNYGRG